MKSDFLSKIEGKTILITGGTGSFGDSVVQGLLGLGPKRIVIFSRDEEKQFHMRNKYDIPVLKFVIGDVRDKESVDLVTEGVDYIFHAAALKQVPSCEFFPMEAVKTNILGTSNVIQAAIENKVKRMVVLSTDKAVYPINAMGMSKALMEKTMIAFANELEDKESETVLCGVRYGNVMYSRGSVIPYFVSLIKQNKKLRITNPAMTRFLFPLPYSVELVLHALTEGKSGAIYVKKAPAADMQTLADALCEIFNYDKGIEIIGIRAGEKFHESLISREEWMRVLDQGDYFCIPPEAPMFDYDKYFTSGKKSIEDEQGYTSENTERLSKDETINLLKTLPQISEELKNIKK